jgi:NTE family protein
MEQLRNGITHLAFEGGGGKGAAYVGALKVLEELGVVQFLDRTAFERKRLDPARIKGVAGTSAGAITACLLAAGYGSRELEEVVKSGIADQFIDDPKPLQCPIIPVSGKAPARIRLVDNAKGFGPLPAGRVSELVLAKNSQLELALQLLIKATVRPKGAMGEKVSRHLAAYVESFIWDMGLFTGEGIRDFLDKFLEAKTGVRNVTFAALFQRTQVHLKVAGVCVNTAEVVWFDHLGPWKNLPVADGVRISMSIPGAFKPIAIDFQKIKPNGIALEGALLFVDGGVLNNLPLHAFDEVRRTVTKAEALLFGGQVQHAAEVRPLNRGVLAFRLTNPADMTPSFYGNGASLLLGVMNALLAQAETNQIRSAAEAEQTIDLDTTDLSTLEFTVDDDTLQRVTARSEGRTRQWITSKLLSYVKRKAG